MNPIDHIIDTHPLKADFDIRLIKHRMGRITLRLNKHNQAPVIPLGTLGNILDCAARVSGHTQFGECLISECEINIHAPLTNELIVSIKISDENQHAATFQCDVHGMVQRAKILIAESHGTVIKLKTELPVVA